MRKGKNEEYPKPEIFYSITNAGQKEKSEAHKVRGGNMKYHTEASNAAKARTYSLLSE
jgi:hypothetical protein